MTRTCEILPNRIVFFKGFLCFIHLLSFITTFGLQINTNTSIHYEIHDDIDEHSDEDVSTIAEISLSRHWNWGHFVKRDVEVNHTLTLEQSFFGSQVDVIVELKKLNDDCSVKHCPLCGGTGHHSSHSHATSQKKHSHVTYPCPGCLGTGVVPDDASCPLFYSINETVSFHIPPGSRPGGKLIERGLGNEVFESIIGDGNARSTTQRDSTEEDASPLPVQKKRGDLIINLQQWLSPNTQMQNSNNAIEFHLNSSSNALEVVVSMSPSDAYYGSSTSIDLMGLQLRVDREGKLTIPGSKVVMKGFGLPHFYANSTPSSFPSSTSSSSSSTSSSNSSSSSFFAKLKGHCKDPSENNETSSSTTSNVDYEPVCNIDWTSASIQDAIREHRRQVHKDSTASTILEEGEGPLHWQSLEAADQDLIIRFELIEEVEELQDQKSDRHHNSDNTHSEQQSSILNVKTQELLLHDVSAASACISGVCEAYSATTDLAELLHQLNEKENKREEKLLRNVLKLLKIQHEEKEKRDLERAKEAWLEKRRKNKVGGGTGDGTSKV